METLMNISHTKKDGIIIFDFMGELDDTNEDKSFQYVYKNILDFSDSNIILDFKKLHFMNSKSIGYIADVLSKCEEAGGIMCICNVHKSIRDVLAIVGLDTVMPILETLDDAIKLVKDHLK